MLVCCYFQSNTFDLQSYRNWRGVEFVLFPPNMMIYDVPLAFDPKQSFEIKSPAFTQPPPPHPPTPQLKINIDRCIMQILESVIHINLWPRWTTFFRAYIYNSSPHTQPYLIILLYIKCKCYKEIPRGLIARYNAIHRIGLN